MFFRSYRSGWVKVLVFRVRVPQEGDWITYRSCCYQFMVDGVVLWGSVMVMDQLLSLASGLGSLPANYRSAMAYSSTPISPRFIPSLTSCYSQWIQYLPPSSSTIYLIFLQLSVYLALPPGNLLTTPCSKLSSFSPSLTLSNHFMTSFSYSTVTCCSGLGNKYLCQLSTMGCYSYADCPQNIALSLLCRYKI